MDLSVIIVSYNVRNFLEKCLVSVLQASQNLDCEVFVVDNKSTDGSCSMIETEFPEVKLIKNPVNRGYSAANNQALKTASGRYVLLLNPDTIVQENAFLSCISFMDTFDCRFSVFGDMSFYVSPGSDEVLVLYRSIYFLMFIDCFCDSMKRKAFGSKPQVNKFK